MAKNLARHLSFCTLLFSLSCKNNSFQGSSKVEPQKTPLKKDPNPTGTTGPGGVVSPVEPNFPVPKNPVVECGNKTRATRIALVLDTSESMGPPLSGSVQPCGASVMSQGRELMGTDPARTGTSIRQLSECFTDRQNAGYYIVNKMASLDKEALKANPTYMGSEIGIAAFPLLGPNNSYVQGYETLSNRDPLKSRMTNLGNLTLDDTFKSGVWEILKRTQQRGGVTPYAEALKAGRDLLKTGRDPNDPRLDLLFLVTDGLPTDQRPSEVVKIKSEITDVKVVYLYMFDPALAEASRNAVAKSSLEGAFKTQNWARQQSNNDGYSEQDFEKYWSDLLSLPKKITDVQINVGDSSQLVPALEGILNLTQSCSK
jgi:hypothetical protein